MNSTKNGAVSLKEASEFMSSKTKLSIHGKLNGANLTIRNIREQLDLIKNLYVDVKNKNQLKTFFKEGFQNRVCFEDRMKGFMEYVQSHPLGDEATIDV